MSEERDELIAGLESALSGDGAPDLGPLVADRHPADLAAAMSGLEAQQQLRLLRELPARQAAGILAELEELSCKHLVRDLDEQTLGSLLACLPSQTAVGVLEHLDEDERNRVLAALEGRLGRAVRQRMVYPEESAGRIMRTEVPRVRIDRDVAQTIETLRRDFGDAGAEARSSGFDGRSLEAVFAVDAQERLVGQVSPARLLLARPEQPLEPLVRKDVPSIPPEMDQEEVADLAVRYDLVALPVVDEAQRLLGMVSFDDIFDVIEQEDVEDLSYVAGTGTDAPTDRMATRAIQARLPWLLVGLVGGLGSAAVLNHFESALDQLVSLAFFVPAVLGLAGAVAVQSSSLTVRGLAAGSMGLRRLPAIAWRELRVSLGMGLALGSLLGAAAFFSTGGNATFGLLLFLVMLLVLMTAAIGGTVIPIVLEKVGVDPAVAMGPFVTALSDLVALAIYMGIASLLLG